MNEVPPGRAAMSAYEQKRWGELQAHWEKKAKGGRRMLPAPAKKALGATIDVGRDAVSKATRAALDHTPESVKKAATGTFDAVLVPTLRNVVTLLELLNEWVVELTDPESVLAYHRERGRNISSLEELRELDLRLLDECTNGMALRWQTIGAGEGAALGSLAMIPVPVVGSAVAIGLDLVVMQALTAAIATRVCYAYGYDPSDPGIRNMVDRMVARSYRDQAVKVRSVRQASSAFDAAKGRVNWSKKLREDHRLMAAVEKLLKSAGGGKRVPVKNARMGMPLISAIAGAATNSYVLGDTVTQARHYGATVLLADKYGLALPDSLRRNMAEDDGEDETQA